MLTERARETEDSSYLNHLLFDAFNQLSNATYQGAHASYAFCNKQFHDLCDYAEYLDKQKHVYWLYGGPDGFVLAYSLLKYIPDLIYNGSKTETAKALREFICNPWGSAVVLTLLAASTIASTFANGMSRDKENETAQANYISWQAFRDGAKGARNANRGIRSTLDAIRLCSFIDLRYALMPLSLLIGIPSMYNRWWSRHMVSVRKKTMDKNDALTKELLNWGRFNQEITWLPPTQAELKKKHANSYLLINKDNLAERALLYVDRDGASEDLGLTPDQINTFIQQKNNLPNIRDQKHPNLMQWRALLPEHADHHFRAFNAQVTLELNANSAEENKNHAHNNRFRCQLSAGYDGLTSGLYLFIGLISLVSLAPEILTIVTGLSAFAAVACIFTRMQEEKEFDRLLRISEEKANLISGIQTLQTELAEAAFLKDHLDIPPGDSYENATPEQHMARQTFQEASDRSDDTFTNISQAQEELRKRSEISTDEAILIGLKHGLIAHGTIVCGIFATSLISKVFFATVLSQAFVVTCVFLSVALTLASIAISVSYAAQHRAKQKDNAEKQLKAVKDIIDIIKGSHDASVLTDIDNETAFSDLCHGTPLINWTFLSWLEILRSMGSGLMKGPKSVDFILLTFFDVSSQHDHEHDNPWITLLLIAAVIMSTIIWTLRAMAKYAAKLREDRTHATPANEENAAFRAGGHGTEGPDDLDRVMELAHNPDAFHEPLVDNDRQHGIFPPHDSSPPVTQHNTSLNIRKTLSHESGLDPHAEQTSAHRALSIHSPRPPRPASTNTIPHTTMETIKEADIPLPYQYA
jgi:hypothetical protein